MAPHLSSSLSSILSPGEKTESENETLTPPINEMTHKTLGSNQKENKTVGVSSSLMLSTLNPTLKSKGEERKEENETQLNESKSFDVRNTQEIPQISKHEDSAMKLSQIELELFSPHLRDGKGKWNNKDHRQDEKISESGRQETKESNKL